MAAKETITAERVRELFNYEPTAGLLTWRSEGGSGAHKHFAGDAAGSKDSHGYTQVNLQGTNGRGRVYRAHRLIWLWMTGEWPHLPIDHKNVNGMDNRWDNLRLATVQQNNANTKAPPHNTSGIKGVGWHSQTKKWRASISFNNKGLHLGLFDSKAEAAAAYRNAAARLFGEFARAE